MPQDRPVPGSVEDWTVRAKGDLVVEADVLTSFAWEEARYLGLNEPVTEGDYEEALRLAETVTAWDEKEIMR